MDMDHPRTVLYAILHKILNDFKPRNNNYQATMDEVFRQLDIIYSVDEPSDTEKKTAQRPTKNRIAKAKKPKTDTTGIKGST